MSVVDWLISSPLQLIVQIFFEKRDNISKTINVRYNDLSKVCNIVRAFKLWRVCGSKYTKRPLKYIQNVFLQFLLYLQHLDLWSVNPAMKKKVRKIFTVSLFYLDPEVVFHTNDVTLNSSYFLRALAHFIASKYLIKAIQNCRLCLYTVI
jgi:hypothetical protein